MLGMKLWQVNVRFNGGRTFEYLSDQENRDLAVAVTIKEAAKQVFWDSDIRIEEVEVVRLSRGEIGGGDGLDGHYEGHGL